MGTVSVACKLPNGLILRVFGMTERYEPVMGGGSRKVEEAAQVGEAVTIKGYAAPFGKDPKTPVAGGYAITTGVDADLWDRWLAQNAEHPAVKAGLIFAAERVDYAKKQAEEQAGLKCGLEPIDASKPTFGITKADAKVA